MQDFGCKQWDGYKIFFIAFYQCYWESLEQYIQHKRYMRFLLFTPLIESALPKM